MGAQLNIALGLIALICALVGGYFLSSFFLLMHREATYKKSISSGENGLKSRRNDASFFNENGLNLWVISFMRNIEVKKPKFKFASKGLSRTDIEKSIRLAGLQDQISSEAFYETRARFFIAGALIGFFVGLIFSVEFACILAILGAFVGAQLPKHVLKNRITKRTYETERHLPEMLDVMALCMRSGLSIDASISIYAKHFDTMLAQELENARRKWTSGLERRDEALKKLASTYDSIVLNRVIDTIIRSIRFGSSMVSNLESDAEEARSAFRSSREEQIAKAPVKMMIPTGVLILPAMLIMVLGPVLLEFMGGGV